MLKHSNIKYCKHRDLYKPLFATRSTRIIDLSENSAQPDNCDSTCHQQGPPQSSRGRRIEPLHQCQLRRRVGFPFLANFFIKHANSTISSLYLFMTKLPPSSLYHLVLIPSWFQPASLHDGSGPRVRWREGHRQHAAGPHGPAQQVINTSNLNIPWY